jgi:CRP/FNR family transcriptional regulator
MKDLFKAIPFTDTKLLQEIEHFANIRHLLKDNVLIQVGDAILFIPIVLKGCVRIIRENEDGSEVFLYHLYPGQTCAMSITCCQVSQKSMIKAIAEDDLTLAMIPIEQTADWQKFPEWKAYVNKNYQERFAELLYVIDLIAFNHMDKQLLHYLKERCKALQTNRLEITHQEIAIELHTQREAISRLLRTMEQKGYVKLSRNFITILE